MCLGNISLERMLDGERRNGKHRNGAKWPWGSSYGSREGNSNQSPIQQQLHPGSRCGFSSHHESRVGFIPLTLVCWGLQGENPPCSHPISVGRRGGVSACSHGPAGWWGRKPGSSLFSVPHTVPGWPSGTLHPLRGWDLQRKQTMGSPETTMPHCPLKPEQ